jgi:peptide/nickel transport system permease protein
LRNPTTFLSLVFLALLLFVAIAAPYISPYDPLEQDPAISLATPSAAHLMGTDRLGRDILSRLIHGSRLSLSVGIFSVLFGLVVGCAIGLAAGYSEGTTDELLMRGIDVLLAFPGILLAILVITILGSSLVNVIVALGIFSIPVFARLTRGAVLATKHLEYVAAARAIGAPTPRVVGRHILPNVMGPIIVYATLRVAAAILGGASLSYLGVGLAPPAPEWGLMISQGRNFMQGSPHVVLFPGLAILFTVLALNLVGDAARDLADPRTRLD